MATAAISKAISDAQDLIRQLECLKTLRFTADLEDQASSTPIGDLDCLLEETKVTMNSIEDRLAEIRKARNFARSRINQLPVELLVSALILAFDESRMLSSAQGLSGVCRYWKQIFNNTPSFWRDISCNESRDLVHKAIRLSSPLSFDIHYSAPATWSSDRTYGISEFYDDILPVMDRCRSLSLWADTGAYFWPLESCPAPAMEALWINGSGSADRWEDGEGNQGEAVDFFHGDAPKLRDLTLQGRVRMPWRSNMLSGLRELRLTYLGHCAPTVAELLSILRQSPDLQILEAEQGRGLDSAQGEGQDLAVTLLALRELRLTATVDSVANDLLSHIHSPNCRSFSVLLNSGTPSHSTVVHTLEHMLQVVRPVAKTVHGTITLDLHNPIDYFICGADYPSAPGNSYDLDVIVGPALVDDQLSRILDAVTPCLSDFEVQVDRIGGANNEGYEPNWTSCLSRLAHVSKLKLNRRLFGDLKPILRHLAIAEEVQGVKRWPLQTLTHLRIEHAGSPEDLQALLDMVRRRNGGDSEADESVESSEHRPRALAMLTLYAAEYDEEKWFEIVCVVGEDHSEVVYPSSSDLS